MAGRIPAQFIDDLVARTDIVDLINSRVALKKAGKDYQACCPFHDEKTPSFTVSREKQFYHCFGCGAHGSSIGFLMEYDNMDFVEAVETLAAREGLTVPHEAGGNQGPDRRPLYDILERVAKFYRRQLRIHTDAKRAVAYLKARGLTGEIVGEYGIGFAPPGYDSLLNSDPDEEAQKLLWVTGMLAESDKGKRYDRFRDRIMFPIRNHRGAVVGFGGRLLGDGKPKYLNSPETPLFHKGRELYGLYEARKAVRNLERLLVVEGYMDVVALAQFGIRNTVATLGTATTTDHLQRIFKTVPELVFCFDGDRAGREAAWKAMQLTLPLMRDGRQARFLFMPQGDDPDTLIRREGSEAFQQRLKNAVPLSAFLFQQFAAEIDLSTEEGRVQLAERAKPLLQQLPEGLFRKLMYRKLAEKVGEPIAAPNAISSQKRPLLRMRTAIGTMPPVRRAIALLLSNPSFALAENLPDNWRKCELAGIPLLGEILDLIRSNPHIHTAALLERWRDRPEGKYLIQLTSVLPPLPAKELETEFCETLSHLASLTVQLEWEALVEQAGKSGLNSQEKQRLYELSQEKAKRDFAPRKLEEDE